MIPKSYISRQDRDKVILRMKETLSTLPQTLLTVRRGDILFSEGDKVKNVGIVVEGLLKCSKYTYSGDEINIHYFYEGETFPEYLVLSGEERYIYNLVAEKRSTILLVDSDHILSLLKSDHEWSNLLLNYMAYRGLHTEKWNLCNCYTTLKSSIAYMLLEIDEITENEWTQHIDSQKVIASKLKVSRPMYNQTLLKLEKENLIKRSDKGIMLLDREKLEKLI